MLECTNYSGVSRSIYLIWVIIFHFIKQIHLILSNQVEWDRESTDDENENDYEPANFNEYEQNDPNKWSNFINELHKVEELNDNDDGQEWLDDSRCFIIH